MMLSLDIPLSLNEGTVSFSTGSFEAPGRSRQIFFLFLCSWWLSANASICQSLEETEKELQMMLNVALSIIVGPLASLHFSVSTCDFNATKKRPREKT